MTSTILLVSSWLEPLSISFSDPIRLDLPPLPGLGQQSTINASALRTLAALYLHAELEQTGIMVVAEALAQARDRLQFLSIDAARKLDELARSQPTSWDRARRGAIFARLFGIGETTRDATTNHAFLQSFTSLCVALLRYEQDDAATSRDATLRYSASAVLYNLAPRHSGAATLAAQQIHRQLQQSIAILSDASVRSHFQSQTMWDVLRNILGDATPDLGRIIRRADSGVRIFDWIASVMNILNAPPLTRLVPRGASVMNSAAQWLEATGVQGVVQ